jgi:uncharacterized protein (TIGR01777 family)
MKVAVTGATGLIGTRLVGALRDRGDSVLALSRNPGRARERLGVEAAGPDPATGAAPVEVLSGIDALVNLAGEPIAQRWSAEAKQRIRASRSARTEKLVAALAEANPRPRVLVSASAAGFYGDRGADELDESSPPGDDFLASVCVDWERAADAAADLGIRVVKLRTGVVLDRSGGALKKMLPPFRAGVGGPVAGGHQYMPWVALDDVAGMYAAALHDEAWSGAVNACAPGPVTNAEFSNALGRALKRPAVLPVPGLALRLVYGEMATVVTASQRMVPRRARELGYEFTHPELDGALKAALGS